MINVLVLTSSFPRQEDSHEGNFIFELVRNISSLSFRIFILAPHFSGGKLKEIWQQVKIYRFLYFLPPHFERLAYGPGLLFNLTRDFFAFVGLIPFFLSELVWSLCISRHKNVHLIHTHWLFPQGLVGAIVRLLTGIPHIATVHGSDVNLIKQYQIFYPLVSFITRYSDAITVNSTYMKLQLESIVPDSSKKIRVIPMGIDFKKFERSSEKNFKKRYHASHLILTVGRLIDWKGTIFLIESMTDVLHHYPDAKLVIVGTGPEEVSLRTKSIKLGLEDAIVFVGNVNSEDLVAYYHSADVFVLPSINKSGRTEALGVVLLEAMASGCPVIGSNVGGIPDIITDGENGFLAPEKNPKAIAEKIVRLLSDTQLWERIKNGGHQTIQEIFSWEIISLRFSDTYSLITKKSLPERTMDRP
jgi:L-malate glycosyltransferase